MTDRRFLAHVCSASHLHSSRPVPASHADGAPTVAAGIVVDYYRRKNR